MTPKDIADKLRRNAKEIVETARGSSRAAMYAALAQELQVLATEVEKLKPNGS